MINIFILCGAYLLNSATNPALPISFPHISSGSPPMRPHMHTSNCHFFFFFSFHHQNSAPMPGTIQVSVVGLTDLPKPETSTSSFTLKVAMGKREYQSMGQGDCLVPVVSIRDRLIVAIHDVEGNEIFQTEFRTMSVVENEVMEDSYPLKSGGYVNMKLQFSLSEEEHARIREMRELALKRKRVEQLQTETKDSDSVQKKGNWITNSVSDEGALLDRSPQTDPVKDSLLTRHSKIDSTTSDTSGSPGATSSQDSEQPSEDPFKIGGGQLIEARKENVEIQTPRSLVPGDATKHSNSDPSTLKENQTRSSVRKMVTAFESSKLQGPEPHFGPRMISSSHKFGVEVSLKRVPSVRSDIDKLKVPQAISKSFSSGMLSDMNSQQNPMLFRSAFQRKQEEMEHVGPAERWETIGKGKVSLEPKNDKNVKSHGSVEQKGVKETAHSANAVASVRFTEKEGEFLKRNFKENLAVISKDDKISDMQTVSETSDERTSSSSEVDAGSRCNAAADISSINDVGNEQSISVNVALSQKVKLECAHMKKEVLIPRKVLDKSSNINRPGSPNTCQQVSVLVATTQQNESECPESHSEKEIVSAPPNGGADLWAYFGDDGCSLENHDVWDTRRLCLTTGTRQLRDLAYCYTHCRGTYPIEEISSAGSSYQDSDTSIEDDENGRSSCTSIEPNPENSLGITKPNGGLIEQVVRIAILVVACGTLLLHTRQRDPK